MTPSPSLVAAALERPGVRVRTLVTLRWIAIGGQFATLIFVGLYLRFPLQWPSLIAAISAAAVLNLGLATLYPRNARLQGNAVLLHLAFDLVQAGVLLFLTGGIGNPFAILLVVPVTISATLLPARAMAALLVLAAAILGILWHWALPLPWRANPPVLPDLYMFGAGVAVLIAMTFLGSYVWLVSAESRGRARALVATEAALDREGKMSALGALAAAAAHELGGPLGTITLIARDLVKALGDDPVHGKDVRLLDAEATRSRGILVGIARRAEAEEPLPRLPLDAVLHEVVATQGPARVRVTVRTHGDLPVVRRTPELLHGLANLVDNAVRHAGSAVELHASADASRVLVTVGDDGPGFDAGILPHLGEPYLGPSRSTSGGTGLGVFIATTLIERTGGRLEFSNRDTGGACVEVRWPRTHIESPVAGATVAG
ncbi:ActS/PrrB/RegB family redox-sensitive histidine kinase [Glacieibacterium frigidum]|uniref:histidine kinase n=2 Tax=Glacieibacterium frigidum TaxID=2593303 RepID=A0A552UAV9_9SPHN|nr:ActS/PrrB/RegB family redox-sensitive histidine kinase [Glacieibacterium frigidum]